MKTTFALPTLSALSLFWILQGCAASVDVKSNVNAEVHVNVKKLFILLTDNEQVDELIVPMGAYMDTILTQNQIQTKVYKEDPLSLDNLSYKGLILDYNPDAVLVISFRNGETLNGGLSQAVFDAVLFDSDLKIKLWRGYVKVQLGASGIDAIWDTYGHTVATEILKKMNEDGVIKLQTLSSDP